MVAGFYVVILFLFEGFSCQEVKFVTVLFRHGDRTPDPVSAYPLDPHNNETYYPIGVGQLTKKGKLRQFSLGQLIRQRYDSFLGEAYVPDIVEAVSTNKDRTKASLQLVLAGLFPPHGKDLDWNSLLKWQPIPYSYTSFQDDMSLTYAFENCPKYMKLYDAYLSSPPGLEYKTRNFHLHQYLTHYTGLNFTQTIKVWGLYACLQSELEWGLKLPQWTSAVFPDYLERATLDVMQTYVATTDLKRLSGGFMLKKIISNMMRKMENKFVPNNRKLVLYSAHDLNVLYLSGVLDQPITQAIPYGSYYIIELVEIRGNHYVQIYRNNYITHEITEVTVPGCEFKCPLWDFARLLKKYIPTDDKECWDV